MTFGDVLKILDPRALLRELKIEVVQGGFEGHVSHLRAEHVKEHRAFVHHDGTVVGGIRNQAGCLTDRRGIFIHQRANGKLVHGAEACFLAGVLLRVKGFGIARQSIADPDVTWRRWKNLNAPPLGRHQARDSPIAGLGVPNTLAQKQDARSRIIAKSAVRHLDQGETGVWDGAKHV